MLGDKQGPPWLACGFKSTFAEALARKAPGEGSMEVPCVSWQFRGELADGQKWQGQQTYNILPA